MRMGLAQYQEAVDTTKSSLYELKTRFAITTAALGLCSEAGEVAGLIKKANEKRLELDSLRSLNLREEIGDCFWYLAQLCNLLGVDACDILGENIAKLQARHPNGFNPNYTEDGKECGC